VGTEEKNGAQNELSKYKRMKYIRRGRNKNTKNNNIILREFI
jgi:hypothetical protein